jgi:hypothetical protein
MTPEERKEVAVNAARKALVTVKRAMNPDANDVIGRIVEKNNKFFRMISESLTEKEKRQLFREIFGQEPDQL